jgi:hypothetical protein
MNKCALATQTPIYAHTSFTFHRTQITGDRVSTVSEARCSGEAAAERRRESGDAGDTERVIREGRRRGEASVRERAWRRSSDAMGGGGGQRALEATSAFCSLL